MMIYFNIGSCLGERQDYVSEDMVVPHAAALDNFLQDLARASFSFLLNLARVN